jgi:hypothetical protein
MAQDGSLREALTSLYGLFNATRELLKGMEPSKPSNRVTIEMLVVRMLNFEIRPFLSKWHVRLKTFETTFPEKPESIWPDNAECREELELLRGRLMDYTIGFGELAGIKDVHDFFRPNAILKRHAPER